jgi:cytoskeletal protein CcmA (bactofilin family)
MFNTDKTRPDITASDEKDDETLTESQVIAFSDVPKSVRNKQSENAEANVEANAEANAEISPNSSGSPVSVIGETLHFKGELSAGEDLVIEGKVEGTINQGKCCLTVKPKGELIADVNATKIFVEGKVSGDLAATVSVTVRESGVVTGNIISPRVAINDGATFNGNIEMRAPNGGKSS